MNTTLSRQTPDPSRGKTETRPGVFVRLGHKIRKDYREGLDDIKDELRQMRADPMVYIALVLCFGGGAAVIGAFCAWLQPF